MATPSEINQGASYVGNAALGAGFVPAITLDTKPIEDLAKYTFLRNKSEYDQRQIDAEKAANEIADYTSYDLTSGIPKDAKYLQDKYDKITAYVREHPDALNYRNKKEWADYKVMRNGLDDDVRSGKVRNTLFMARQEEINNEKNPAEKARLQASLEKEVAATDIRTPLQHTNKFDVEQVQYAAPKKLSFTVSKEFPNYLSETNVLTTDMSDLNAQANSIILGLSKFTNPQSPLEQQQFEAQANTGKLEPILSAKSLSAVMSPYVVNGVFDAAAAKNSGNSILAGNIANVEAYNQRMRDMKSAIKSGAFQDKLSGGVAAFGVTGLNENDYAEIDLNKGGVSPEELVKMKLLGLAQNTQSKTDIKPTDNAIQKMQIGETARHNKAEEGLARERLNLDKKKFSGTNAEDVLGADAVLSEVASIIKNRTLGKNMFGRLNGVDSISDPTLLKEFGTIDKDGKTTNVPDKVSYDSKKDELILVYEKKDESGDLTGKEEEKRLNPRTWLGQKVRQKFPNKDIGSINNIVEQTFKEYGGNLLQLSEKYGIGDKQAPSKKETPEERAKRIANGG